MTVQDLVKLVDARCMQALYDDNPVENAYSSDLLSDVLANAPEKSVLITVQAHKNTVAVASMKESPAIIVCNNRVAPEDMIAAAADERIAVFVTGLDQFTVSGRLYTALGFK